MSSNVVTSLIVIGFGAVMCLSVLAVIGVGYFFIIRPNIERTKVVNSNWELFAREKSLAFVKGGYPRISGLYQGREVKLAVINPNYDFEGSVRIGGQTAKVNYLITRTSATVKENDLELKVYLRGLLDQALGEQTPAIGNEVFDAKFHVSCSSPERVKSILTPEIQSALLERQINLLNFHNGTLYLNAIGMESRPVILEAFLVLVCKIADGIENR